MSKHRVAVLKVVSKQLSITAAAAEFGMSRQHLHRLLRRYRTAASGPSSHARASHAPTPGRTPDHIRERVVALRTELVGRGLDGGPVTIAWHLGREGLAIPSTSTIRRILYAAGLVTPEPRKRPRSSWIRFEAAAPNELWQSDFTHWRLADGTEVEILDWLDDHARFLLAVTAFGRVSGDDVVATFVAAGEEHGWPAQQGCHHPAAGRPPPPPQDRRGLRPPTGPRHRRRAGGHGRRPRNRRDPLDPPHRA